MDGYEPYLSLGIALAAGLLIGFEREGSVGPEERATSFLGGARTHPLVALAGAVATLLAPALGIWPLVLSFAAFFALVLVSYAQDVRRGQDRGLTSETAFLLTFLLGCLSATRDLVGGPGQKAVLVLAIAVVTTLLLSVKPKLHALAARASQADLLATLKFLIVAVVVLPHLPHRPMGPLGALDPYAIGWMVVLIAGIGFVGYLASRILGPGRGVALTGLVGGLVSSTAVTLSFAGRARSEPALARICAPAILLASTIMFPRVLVVVGIVHPPLLRALAFPLLAAAAGATIAGAILFRGAGRKTAGAEVPLENPFELASAVKLGLVFSLVLVLAKVATTYLGAGGTYLAGLLAGATDVDAIAVSMANLARSGGVAEDVAANAVLIGAGANTVAKAALASAIGRAALARPLLPAFAAALAAGALGFVLAP
jgi:uncharacterized membrane protein (DUF4010 family)